MAHFLIAVIDRSYARLFTFEESKSLGQLLPALIERKQLHNESARQNAQDLWSDTQAGSNRSVVSHTYSYDDRRAQHILEFERRFIAEVVDELLLLRELYQPSKLILVARSQTLGLVRKALSATHDFETIRCYELNKDLGHFTAPEVHQYLADKALVASPYRAIS